MAYVQTSCQDRDNDGRDRTNPFIDGFFPSLCPPPDALVAKACTIGVLPMHDTRAMSRFFEQAEDS